MRKSVVISGGPSIYDDAAVIISDFEPEVIYCADSGADFALNHNIRPTRVFGDMDSVSAEGRVLIEKLNIPITVYPVEKDKSDTEICLRELSDEDEILLVCSMSGRVDHLWTNLNLISKLHSEGYSVTATDGVTDVIPMRDGETVSLGGIIGASKLSISLIPLTPEVKGVTISGVKYPLNDATLIFGDSYSHGNSLADGSDSFSVTVGEGLLSIVITPID